MKSEIEIPETEEEVPFSPSETDFKKSTENKTLINDRDWFNTIKGHNLLGWCIAIIVMLYLCESFFNQGKMSEIGKSVLEIIKLLVFSLSGYLFGTSKNENNDKK